MTIKKQFIAGAECPQCSALDTLVLWQENESKRFECVACHYQQQLEQSESSSEQVTTQRGENLIQWIAIDNHQDKT